MTGTPDLRRIGGALVPYFKTSDPTALDGSGNATVEFTGIPNDRAHWFVAVEYYSDAAGLVPVSPSAGTATFTVKTHVLPGAYQSISGGTVNASANAEVGFQAAAAAIKVVLATVSGNGAAYVRLRIIGLPT